MTGYQLHDSDSQEILGSVIQSSFKQFVDSQGEIEDGWEAYNKLEETEDNTKDIDAFIIWFNERYVTQIERLYLEPIQL